MKKNIFTLLLILLNTQGFTQTSTPILTLNTAVHTAKIGRISTDSLGKLILTCSKDKTAKLWNSDSGELIKTFRIPIDEGKEGMLYAAAISPNGKTVALGGWTSKNGANTSIYIFDVATNSMKNRITELPTGIMDIEFSPNGNYMVATLGGSNGIRVFETNSWSLIQSITDYGASCFNAAFDNSGRLATVCDDGKIRLYNRAFELMNVIETTTGKEPYSLAFSPDGSLLAVGYNDSYQIQVLDGETLQLLYEPDLSDAKTVSGRLEMVSFSSDGLNLLAGGYLKKGSGELWMQIRVWADRGRGTYSDYPAAQNSIMDIKPMPDNSFIFCGSNPDFGRMNTNGTRLFYKTAETYAYNSSNQTHLKTDISGNVIGVTPFGQADLTFSVADRLLSVSSFSAGTSYCDNYLEAKVTNWNISKHPEINLKGIRFLETNELNFSVDISKVSGKIIFGTCWNIYCTDSTGNKLWNAPVQSGAWCVNISDNDKVLVAGLGDGTICWYNMKDGTLLLSLFIHPESKRWVLWSPKGYFDCSTGAEALIGWHLNQGSDKEALFYPISKFRDTYYRPDIISKILSTYNEEEAITLANEASNRKTNQKDISQMLPPVVSIITPENEVAVNSTTVTVHYKVNSPNNEPVTSVKVLIDGRPLEMRGFKPVNNSDEITITIPQNNCTIGIIAENRFGVSVPANININYNSKKTVLEADILKPTLYVLAIGISDYKDTNYKLGFAAKDAIDFTEALKIQNGQLYKDVKIKILTNDQATRSEILDGLDWLQRQTTSHDVAMLFMAGHGVNDNAGVFYFVPYEADVDKIKSTCLMFAEVKNTVSAIAGKIIVFADACHSGNIMGSKRRALDINGLVNDLSSSETGAVVFTSSTGKQYSLENPNWNNGAFTKALVEGLNGKADLMGKGKITIKTLDAYISERVKELTNGQQSPTTIIPESIPDFPISIPLR